MRIQYDIDTIQSAEKALKRMEKLDLVEEAKKKKTRELVIGHSRRRCEDEAMVAREKPEMAMAQLTQSVADMDAVSAEATTKVGEPVLEYTRLSLSGTFVG
ncbi:uncharacterized protein FIBRA_08843 [Fibroporia radiculosa]|uniref:Uncharacterized protein n=1 Tax=Fibroporia radiculosa TaxID=599839 RepID=J4I3E6_9APHY|nr:uncharacterized protein FIBRA_08843 [Fibroporia radiculosa]CCM06567.1 predicted protein [Fibroporia radiculosa]